MLALALLLATPLAQDPVAARVAGCGIDRAQIRVDLLATLEESAIIDTPSTGISDAQFACLIPIAMETGWMQFTDPAAQARFVPLLRAANRTAAVAEARDWLARHGKLAGLPAYDRARGLASFTRALEQHCGATPGTVLGARGSREIRLLDGEYEGDQIVASQCAAAAALASDPAALGFILTANGSEISGVSLSD